MATRGTPIPATTQARIQRLAAAGVSERQNARESGVARMTVRKYGRPVSGGGDNSCAGNRKVGLED